MSEPPLEAVPAARRWDLEWAETVPAVLVTLGGDDLVLDALSRVPQVHDVEITTGWRSTVHAVAVGDRRFRANGDGRLVAEHVVGDVVLSTTVLAADDAGRAVAAALNEHVRHFGTTVLSEIEAALAGLRSAL